MNVWRIDKEKYAASVLSGTGCQVYPGRWHYVGTIIVYTSGTPSLAALERFAHLTSEMKKMRHVISKIRIPKEVKVESIHRKSLPPGWDSIRATLSTQDIGTQWVRSMTSAVLRVPTVHSAHEYNYLLNPLHPDFKRVEVLLTETFKYDSRLWKASVKKLKGKSGARKPK